MLGTLKKIFPSEDWMPARRMLAKDPHWWRKLHRGARLRFGYMAQPELSGVDVHISDVQHYDFGQSHFTSHVLAAEENGTPLCQVIIAERDNGDSYLALSRHVTETELYRMCGQDDVALLLEPAKMSKLYVREVASGLSGWVTIRYTKQIEGVRGSKQLHGGRRDFNYTLLVSDDNDRAIEVEHYDDGRCEIYVTVYRPISDIVQVQSASPSMQKAAERFKAVAEAKSSLEAPKEAGKSAAAPKQTAQKPVESAAPKPAPKPAPAAENGIQIAGKIVDETAPNLVREAQPKPETPKPEAPKSVAQKAQLKPAPAGNPPVQRKAVNIRPIETVAMPEMTPKKASGNVVIPAKPAQKPAPRPAPIPSAPPARVDSDLVNCEMRVAAKVLDEALRNEMRVSDVVRRVLGLPLHISEQVGFHVALTDKDYAALAMRYKVDPKDHTLIRQKMADDLAHFTGESTPTGDNM